MAVRSDSSLFRGRTLVSKIASENDRNHSLAGNAPWITSEVKAQAGSIFARNPAWLKQLSTRWINFSGGTFRFFMTLLIPDFPVS
jgi:hypothetical protein